MKRSKVLMLGTDVSTRGGIASVIQDYIDSGLMSRLGVTYIPTHKDGSKAFKVTFFFSQLAKVIPGIMSANIVHIHTSHGWSFRRLACIQAVAKLLGRKTIMHVHGSQFDIYYRDAGSLERLFIRKTLAATNTVIALSEDWEKKLLAIQPEASVLVVRNSVDHNKFEQLNSRSLHDPVNLLFLGRLGERKGVYDILESLSTIDLATYHCVLAGDGDVEEVRKIVRDRGWQDCVEVPGWVGPDKKMQLLEDADIYLLPSYHEGLPISILEAMAAGLPVVSTPVGGIPEAVRDGENGFLVTPGNVAELAKRIQYIGSTPTTWRSMSDASRQLSQNEFAMQAVEDALSALYAKLAQH